MNFSTRIPNWIH